MANTFPLVSDEVMDELGQRGSAIYEKLKPILEPAFDKKFVAIHVDTEDYEVGRSSGDAWRAMLKRRPVDGRLFIRKIGSEPEYGLAARMLAGQMRERSPK